MLLVSQEKSPSLDNPASPTQETLPPIEIMYYEDIILEDEKEQTIAPSNKIQMENGKVVYKDGTEKSWLELYKEEETLPKENKTFFFKNGTILIAAFNSNTLVEKIIVPDGIVAFENCFNNNESNCTLVLPTTLETYTDTFKDTKNLSFESKQGAYITVKNNTLYADAETLLLFYPNWNKETELLISDKVKTIGREAIVDNTSLKEIVVGETVETIEFRGIVNCPNVTEVVLPESLKSINSAFSRMTMLKELTIPANCELLGVNFMQCPWLHLKTYNSAFYTISDDVLYNKEKTILIRYLESKKDTEFIMPDSVEEIKPSAFAFNKYLENLTINDGITTIGTFFTECNALTSVNLPESITNIKTMAFTRLPKLITINFAGTMEQWIHVQKGTDWIITSLEYHLNCSDESVEYKGTA